MAARLLDGVAISGVSSAYLVRGAKEHTIQTDFSNSGGSITALTVDLEGTINNRGAIDDGTATWFSLASDDFEAGDLTAKGKMFHIISKNVEFVRANISTLTDTGTSSITVRYQDHDGSLKEGY